MIRRLLILLILVPLLAIAQEQGSASLSADGSEIAVPQLQVIDKINWYSLDVPVLPYYEPLSDGSTFRLNNSPYSADFSANANIASWRGGAVYGYGARETMPGLMQSETGAFMVSQQFGNIVFTGGVSANKYGFYRALHTLYGIHGTITYRLNDCIAFTAFGSHYNGSLYYSPAAMPFIRQSNYGAYVDVGISDRFGVGLGVQRVYNALNGAMETVPIVRPYFKINNKVAIEVDAGYLIKDALFDSNSKRNPTMAPPRPEIPIAPRK